MKYEKMQPSANKMLNPDGSISKFDGTIMQNPNENNAKKYIKMQAMANKFLDSDGITKTLADISGNTLSVTQEPGQDATKVMSQKATTDIVLNPNGQNGRVMINSTTMTSQTSPSNVTLIDSNGISKIGNNSVLIGAVSDSSTQSDNCVAIGFGSKVREKGIAIGSNVNSSGITGISSIAIGNNSYASLYGISIGENAKANATNSVAIGRNSLNNNGETVSFGSGNSLSLPETRRLTNITDPIDAQDAVTKRYFDNNKLIGPYDNNWTNVIFTPELNWNNYDQTNNPTKFICKSNFVIMSIMVTCNNIFTANMSDQVFILPESYRPIIDTYGLIATLDTQSNINYDIRYKISTDGICVFYNTANIDLPANTTLYSTSIYFPI